jgi:hypothetical protein
MSDYRRDLEAFLSSLDASQHEDEQVSAWVEFLQKDGYGVDEVFDVVVEATQRLLGRETAEALARKVRRKLMWTKRP